MAADFWQDLVGRAFLPEEDRTIGSHQVAVISHRCWQRRFAGDPSMVGKTIELNNLHYTVIGIAPPEFSGLVRGMSCDVWAPMMMTPQLLRDDDTLNNRGARSLSLLGRLKSGVTVKQGANEFFRPG